MEKRLIIAVLLSLLILYVWAGLTQRNTVPPSRFDTQDIGNKEFITKSTAIDRPLAELEMYESSPAPIQPDLKNEQLTLIDTEKLSVSFSSLGGGIKEIYIRDYDERMPVTNIDSLNLGTNSYFTLDKLENNMITYIYTNSDQIIKNTYTVSLVGYDIQKKTVIINKSEMSKKADLNINLFTIDANRMDISDKNQDKSLFEYAINAYDGILRKSNAYKFNIKEQKESDSHLVWSAYRNRYFALINKPLFNSNGYKLVVLDDRMLSVQLKKTLELGPGESEQWESLIFTGPETHEILSSYKLELEKVKKFYRFGLFDLIALFIYRLMGFIHKIIPNWGVSIVLISMILYFSMYPLTLRGMSSMKRMQALQPEIAKLKEKYSTNPQKMNQEMMLLYKEHKINPVGGCLPFLLQMPIFIGLYQVLWRSVSFKGAGFLWIEDLSKPDRFYVLPFKLPLMGDEINLLPILMMIIMFVQQRITAKSMVVVDPIQKQQQKMMGILMPIFLGVIFYKFASGLTLYFTLFYIFSTFTQFYMYKKKTV